MKLLTLTLVFILSSLTTQAATLKCRNEAHSAVTASLSMNASSMKMIFGKGSDGGHLEEDIKNKSLNLKLNQDGSYNGYVQYEGDVAASAYDYRTVQVRIQSSLLSSKAEFHVTFYISNSHGKNAEPYQFSSYGMLCLNSTK